LLQLPPERLVEHGGQQGLEFRISLPMEYSQAVHLVADLLQENYDMPLCF
jgi:hypothetical protein